MTVRIGCAIAAPIPSRSVLGHGDFIPFPDMGTGTSALVPAIGVNGC